MVYGRKRSRYSRSRRFKRSYGSKSRRYGRKTPFRRTPRRRRSFASKRLFTYRPKRHSSTAAGRKYRRINSTLPVGQKLSYAKALALGLLRDYGPQVGSAALSILGSRAKRHKYALEAGTHPESMVGAGADGFFDAV